MSVDLSIVNTALIILAGVAVVQLAALVAVVVWVRRTSLRASLAFDEEVRPVLAGLSRAAEEVESAGRGVGEVSEDARRVLSSVRHAAASVAPVFAPRTWVAARVMNWAVRKGARRLAARRREHDHVESTGRS